MRVHVVQSEADVPPFQDFVRRNIRCLAFDTETTGLDIFQPDFRVRLAQFGAETEAWVIPVELGKRYRWLALQTLNHVQALVCHNATFDLLVAEKTLGADLRTLYDKTTDTQILSRLVDSRSFKEGGHGHSLEDLTRAFIDPTVATEIKGSIGRLATEMKVTKTKFWKVVPLDHDGYTLYAGFDVILTSMLARILHREVPTSARKLIRYEHDLARICAEIQRNGVALDREYTERQVRELGEVEAYWVMQAEAELLEHTEYEGETYWDLDGVQWGSTQQMAAAFMDRGISEFTFTAPTKANPQGQIQVDEAFLAKWAERGDNLAEAIREAKKAAKWRKTWFQSFLDNADATDRCHANINTMEARTARMSITGFPAQTLPAGQAFVRNCLLADPGEVIASIDYSNMELRVMAALSGDPVMTDAFLQGKDLHQITADAAGVTRSGGKTGNFSKAFGGGAQAIADGAGVSLDVGQQISDAFDNTYKGVTRFSKALQKEARWKGYVESATGRRLYVDKSRAYSALNYVVQSTSRDITGAALVRLDRAGFTERMRLPIHDEILFSFPEGDAKELADEASRIMLHTIRGMPVPTDPEVGSRSWGSLYESDTKH